MSEEMTPPEGFDEQADLAAELDAAKAEVEALKEQVLRYAADTENTKRRVEREANDARAYAIQKFAGDLLAVADNLARALNVPPPAAAEDTAVKNFVIGVEMTEKDLQSAFERNGLKRIHPQRGDKFDPHKHQAMAEQPGGDVAAGGVLEVYQSGYELLGRLVRPAMVVVAAKSAAQPAPPAGDGGPNPYDGAAEDAGGSVDTRA